MKHDDEIGLRRKTIALVPKIVAQARAQAKSHADAWAHERRLRARAEEALALEITERARLETQLLNLQRGVSMADQHPQTGQHEHPKDGKTMTAKTDADDGTRIAESDPYM